MGTDTRTDTTTVSKVSITAQGALQAGTFVADVALAVPINAGAPTFDSGHNEVRWSLQIETDEPLPTFDKNFKVVVSPSVTPDFRPTPRSTIQDA